MTPQGLGSRVVEGPQKMIIEELSFPAPLNRISGDEKLHALNVSEHTPMLTLLEEMSVVPKKKDCIGK